MSLTYVTHGCVKLIFSLHTTTQGFRVVCRVKLMLFKAANSSYYMSVTLFFSVTHIY